MEVSLEKEKHLLAKLLHQVRPWQALHTAGGSSALAKEKKLPAWRVRENMGFELLRLSHPKSLSQVSGAPPFSSL